MTNKVKMFLENNYELLDSNPVQFFLNMYNSFQLSNKECIDINKMLIQANIDNTSVSRVTALDSIILDELTTLGEELRATYNSECTIFVKEFIEVCLNNRLGLSTFEIMNYMTQNSTSWRHIVEIYNDDNYIPTIRWR